MAILTVGASQQFATIAAAVAAAQAGDTVQIQAGTYTNDFPHVTVPLTIVGMGGIVHLVATVPPPDGKSIMTVDASATISNLDFSGAKVADANGAGIRYEGGDLTLNNCSFHDNENGILTSSVNGTLTINGCNFDHNGNGNGLTHNLYVGDVTNLVVTNSTFTDAVVGHEIKSRAENTTITGCTIADGPNGNGSYSIDLPNGGNAVVKNNIIEKGPNTENYTVVHFGGEGIPYAGSQLTLSGNTITNDLPTGQATLVLNQTLTSVKITGNALLGNAYGAYASGPAVLTGNTGSDGAAVADTTNLNLAGGGQTTFITDAADHNLVLPTAFLAVLDTGAGHLTATGYSHETVIGGSGGLTWNGQTGADAITTKAGSANLLYLGNAGNGIDSEGVDSIVGSTGNDTVAANGTATIEGSTGNCGYAIGGNAVLHSHGADTIGIGPGANAQITTGTFTSLSNNGGSFSLSHRAEGSAVADTMTVKGGALALKAYGVGVNVTVAGGSHGAELDLGTGQHVVISSAPDTIRAGSGADTVIIGGNAAVYGGTGALSVFGRGIQGQATIHGGAGTTTIDGDTGNIEYIAEGGPATVEERLSNVAIVGGASKLTVNAHNGRLSIQGGTGGLVFNDLYGGGDSIQTAAGARDTLNLMGASDVTSNGTDLISLGGGGNYNLTANGAATVIGSTGNSYFTLNGQDTLLTRSTMVDRGVVGANGNAQIVSISALDDFNVLGGRLHYLAMDISSKSPLHADVSVRGQAEISRAAGGNAVVSTRAGAATQVTTTTAGTVNSAGADTINAGAGYLNVNASGSLNATFGAGGGSVSSSGPATIHGGAGALTVQEGGASLSFVGGAGSALLNIAGGAAQVTAGSGNTTLNGGGGLSLVYQAGSGASVLQLGGNSTVLAGTGATTVQCGAGREVIEVQAGRPHGAELVVGFKDGVDQIKLDGYAPGAATQTTYAGGVQLNLIDGTQIKFAGIAHLTAV